MTFGPCKPTPCDGTLAGEEGDSLIQLTGGIPIAVVILSGGPVVSLLLIARGLPEPSGRTLEELNDDDVYVDLESPPEQRSATSGPVLDGVAAGY